VSELRELYDSAHSLLLPDSIINFLNSLLEIRKCIREREKESIIETLFAYWDKDTTLSTVTFCPVLVCAESELMSAYMHNEVFASFISQMELMGKRLSIRESSGV